MAGDPPQPECQVGRRFQILQVSKQFEEHLLREVFRDRSIAHDMVRDTKDHRLMLPHDCGEGGVIARLCARKRFIGPSGKSNGPQHAL
jgi:hypothetical protein